MRIVITISETFLINTYLCCSLKSHKDGLDLLLSVVQHCHFLPRGIDFCVFLGVGVPVLYRCSQIHGGPTDVPIFLTSWPSFRTQCVTCDGFAGCFYVVYFPRPGCLAERKVMQKTWALDPVLVLPVSVMVGKIIHLCEPRVPHV